MKLQKIKPLTNEFLESIGFVWHTDSDNTSYVADEIVVLSEEEAENYYNAANELYEMFVKAGDYVIENDLLNELDIPFNLIELVKLSWENDVHWHIYSRFDFAGGVDGKPIKLLEFNADTPTALFETAIIQWAMLKANAYDEEMQFNFVYEAIRENFKRLVVLDNDTEEFDELYKGWKILFTSVKGNIEDENTTKLLQKIADEAGFVTKFAYIEDIEFSDDGIFYEDEEYEYLFKLIPWESIAIEEADLALYLTNIVKNQKAIILNPAYTLMFQSKRFLKILWDLYPNHPLLLETSFEPLKNKPYVKKVAFGREGENISIFDQNGNIIEENGGEYENFKPVYQEYVELPTDEKGNSYQAGVFFAYEGCGVGFRRGNKILNNMSKFVGHRVE
jgi:glutathionylspermidine synthase